MSITVIEIDHVFDELVPPVTTLPIWEEDKLTEYHITPVPGYVVDSTVYMNLRLQIRKYDTVTGVRSRLEAADQVAIINFPISSIWRACEVFLNQKLINGNNAAQTYTNFLRALSDFPNSIKNNHLKQVALWAPDAPNQFNVQARDVNPNYHVRHAPFVNDGMVDLYAPLMFDIFRQPQPFSDDTTILIRLQRNNNRFCINATATPNTAYELGIIRADLCITRHRTVQKLRDLVGPTLKYPYGSFETSYFVVPQNITSVSQEIRSGVMPSKVFILQIAQDGFNGSFAHNGLLLEHNNLKQAHLIYNNTTILPPQGYQMETATVGNIDVPIRYTKTYTEVLKALCDGEHRFDLGLEPKAFIGGTFILAWDLRRDRQPHLGKPDQPTGSLRFIAELYKVLPSPMVLLCCFLHDRVLTIEPNGNVEAV